MTSVLPGRALSVIKERQGSWSRLAQRASDQADLCSRCGTGRSHFRKLYQAQWLVRAINIGHLVQPLLPLKLQPLKLSRRGYKTANNIMTNHTKRRIYKTAPCQNGEYTKRCILHNGESTNSKYYKTVNPTKRRILQNSVPSLQRGRSLWLDRLGGRALQLGRLGGRALRLSMLGGRVPRLGRLGGLKMVKNVTPAFFSPVL